MSNIAAYQSSNPSARNRANSPHKYTSSSSSGKGKGKEREPEISHTSNKKKSTKTIEFDDESSDEEPLPVQKEEKKEKKKLRRASDDKPLRKEESINSINGSSQIGNVDILPPEALQTAVPIDDFLFT